MEAHKCKRKGMTHIGFLDPMMFNEKTFQATNSDPKDTLGRLATAIKACEHKESILLAYKCEYVFP